MKARQIRNILKLVHEIFPLPEGFKGTHGFMLSEDRKLHLTVWFPYKDNIFCRDITFDNHDTLTRFGLLQIKSIHNQMLIDFPPDKQVTPEEPKNEDTNIERVASESIGEEPQEERGSDGQVDGHELASAAQE